MTITAAAPTRAITGGATPFPEAAAETVAARLGQRVASLDGTPHELFARLYRCSTIHWLDRLSGQPDADIVFRLIPHFFALYEKRVGAVIAGRGPCSAHWKPYFDACRSPHWRHRPADAWRIVVAGVHAHTTIDLRDAIVRTVSDHRLSHGRPPDLDVFETLMFGSVCDRSFAAAAVAFCDHNRRTAGPLLGSRLAAQSPNGLIAVWGRWLHAWRWSAWTDARARIAWAHGPS
jgi:hypothetical protein